MRFKIVDKRLILVDYGRPVYEGENGYEPVEVEAKRFSNGTDLSLMSFRFSAVSVAEPENAACQVLYKDVDENDILRLTGSLTSDFSALTGKVIYSVTGVGANGITAKFMSVPLEITDDISVVSAVGQTPAEQLLSQVQLEVQRAIDAADEARELLESFTAASAPVIATETDAGIIRAGGDISVSDSGAVTVNSVNGRILGTDVPSDAVFTDTVYDDAELRSIIGGMREYMGCVDSDVIGLCADFEKSEFTRLGASAGKNGGSDFDGFSMYGGRRRCTVLDDGTITAYYGDAGYAEDGSCGQVMVYQPAFYYKVVPLKIEPISDGTGFHLRKANYYISSSPKNGFRLHPAFYDENGRAVGHILLSAYEGSVFDVSANAYLESDEQVADFSANTGDRLSSVSGVKPCSGKSQQLNRTNSEQIAKNRGSGWHTDNVKTVSVNQLLMVIEYAMFNMQSAIGNGIVNVADAAGENRAAVTGGTSSLGSATGTVQLSGDTRGNVYVSYRGVENPWGNIGKFVNGLNIFGNGSQKGGIPYICSDYNFAEMKNSGNYSGAGFTVSNNGQSGYISAFGYSPEYDWLFIPSEAEGSSSAPVGDTSAGAVDLNGYKVAYMTTYWGAQNAAGLFGWVLNASSNVGYRTVSSRLVYIPQN